MAKNKTKESFKDMLDRYLDLQFEDQENKTHKNRHKSYRLLLKMISTVDNLEDMYEVLCLLNPKSKYFKTIFDKAHSLINTFEGYNRLLTCCFDDDEYYFLVLQDKRRKATTLEEWFVVYGDIEYLFKTYIDYLVDDHEPFEYDEIITELSSQLKDAMRHIIDLSKTAEDFYAIIFMLSHEAYGIEEVIKKRDLLIKEQK